MTIPTVIHVITLLELGGAQEITLFTARHLDRGRYRVHLVCGRGGMLDREALAIPDLTVHFIDDLLREIRPQSDLRCFARLRSLFAEIARDAGPTIVHTHSSKAGIVGRLAAAAAGVDVRVHSIHGFAFHPRQRAVARQAYRALERIVAPLTHAFTGDSQANLEVAGELGLLRGDKATLFLPPGIRAADYREGDRFGVRRELGIEDDRPLVGMLACLKPQKSPIDFVAAAARVVERHPQTHFFIAGDGELRSGVEEAIASHRLGGAFHLLGWRRDVPSLLAAADIVALTSLHEGLPRALLQSMAAGRPIVASRVDGVPEAVEDGVNGFLVAPRDVDGFANRIGLLVADPVLRERMGRAGSMRTTTFDSFAGLERLQALYDRLLERNG